MFLSNFAPKSLRPFSKRSPKSVGLLSTTIFFLVLAEVESFAILSTALVTASAVDTTCASKLLGSLVTYIFNH